MPLIPGGESRRVAAYHTHHGETVTVTVLEQILPAVNGKQYCSVYCPGEKASEKNALS
jgi:hypothetical protein